jgi:hypothetical protein
LLVQGFFTTNENDMKLYQFRAVLEAGGDGECYFPCYDCRGLKRRRILIKIVERHCREKGHAEGGYEYYPLVRGYLILNVFSIIFIMS